MPRLELLLIACMALGATMILQRWSFSIYRAGLVTMLGATVLNIAVGNLPRNAPAGRAVLLTGSILVVVATVFVVGILLVPTLSELGQGS